MKQFVCFCVITLVAVASLFAAKPIPGRLDVSVRPEGAEVFVDGKLRGAAPCSIFDLEAGIHRVRVEAPSCISEDAFVKIKSGEVAQKNFLLQEEKGLVLVKTAPYGADVKCNGVSLGTTPLLITTLSSGRKHTLELSLNGFQTKRIDVQTDGRHPLVREETLALNSGTVNCTTEPSGAVVILNGVERGITPIELSNVPKGVSTILFRMQGYADESRELRLSPGDKQTLAVQMKGIPAKLTVVSTPDRARVFIDDDYQGKTPVTTSGLKPGTHTVRLELAGHAPIVREVKCENGDVKTEEFRLENVLGRLEVVTIPAGAKISLDGKGVGTTRSSGGNSTRSQILSLEGVSTGEHSVLVHLDGYMDVSRMVTIKAKDTTKLFIKLSRVFRANTEIETIRGVHRGVLVEKDFLGNVTLEISPGVQQTFRADDIRKIKTL